MQLYNQRYGAGDPLIVLHGLFGSLSNWSRMSKILAEQYLIIAVDQRNHGSSPHASGQSSSAWPSWSSASPC